MKTVDAIVVTASAILFASSITMHPLVGGGLLLAVILAASATGRRPGPAAILATITLTAASTPPYIARTYYEVYRYTTNAWVTVAVASLLSSLMILACSLEYVISIQAEYTRRRAVPPQWLRIMIVAAAAALAQRYPAIMILGQLIYVGLTIDIVLITARRMGLGQQI